MTNNNTGTLSTPRSPSQCVTQATTSWENPVGDAAENIADRRNRVELALAKAPPKPELDRLSNELAHLQTAHKAVVAAGNSNLELHVYKRCGVSTRSRE